MKMRTTIRIDHEEGDPKVRDLLSWIQDHGFGTSHTKGMIRTNTLNGEVKVRD